MKILTEADGYWENKVNFVDDNDVFVGYDLSQCCCEHADWFIGDDLAKYLPEELNQPNSLDGYNFDKEYFEELSYLTRKDEDWNTLDAGSVAVFKLTNGKDEKFLHLFNCHNGYYGHGFEVKHGGEVVNEGYL